MKVQAAVGVGGWLIWGGGQMLYATSQGCQQIETSVAEYGKRAHSKGCWEFVIGC